MKSKLIKHIESEHTHSCDKCDFVTSNKMHLKMHVKSCHKKNQLNKVNEPKKRKSTEEIQHSRKKTKNNVVSKKVKMLIVLTSKIDNYPKGKTKCDNYPKGI